jgi:hypothetical protein
MEPIISLLISNAILNTLVFGVGVIGGSIVGIEIRKCLDCIFNSNEDREQNQENIRLRVINRRSYTE